MNQNEYDIAELRRIHLIELTAARREAEEQRARAERAEARQAEQERITLSYIKHLHEAEKKLDFAATVAGNTMGEISERNTKIKHLRRHMLRLLDLVFLLVAGPLDIVAKYGPDHPVPSGEDIERIMADARKELEGTEGV